MGDNLILLLLYLLINILPLLLYGATLLFLKYCFIALFNCIITESCVRDKLKLVSDSSDLTLTSSTSLLKTVSSELSDSRSESLSCPAGTIGP